MPEEIKDVQSRPMPSTQPNGSNARRSNGKLFSVIIKLIFGLIAAVVVALLYTLWYNAFNRADDENVMRGYFLHWRNISGIDSMNGEFRFIKKEYHPDAHDGRVGKFMDIAQNNEVMQKGEKPEKASKMHGLLHDLNTIHLPRNGALHFSFFENYDKALEHFYNMRVRIRRYVGDEKFMKKREKLGNKTSPEALKPLFDRKEEERMVFEPPKDANGKLKNKNATKYDILFGLSEPLDANKKSLNLDKLVNDGKDKASVYYKQDFKHIVEDAGYKEYYDNLYILLNKLHSNETGKNEYFKLPENIKDKKYAEIGKAAKEKNKELFEILEKIAKETYGDEKNYFYDYRYVGNKDYDESRDINYSIYKTLAGLGMARPETVYSLFYSQMFYHFYYATLTVKLNTLKLEDELQEEKNNRARERSGSKTNVEAEKVPRMSRIVRVARSFDYIFSKIYVDKSKKEYDESKNYFVRLLSPNFFEYTNKKVDKKDVYLLDDVEKDAKVLMEGFKNNLYGSSDNKQPQAEPAEEQKK